MSKWHDDTGPETCIDTAVMEQCISQPKEIKSLSDDRPRVLFVDKCSGDNTLKQMVSAAMDINGFGPNATHLVQNCKTFAIQNTNME